MSKLKEKDVVGHISGIQLNMYVSCMQPQERLFRSFESKENKPNI